MQKVIDLLDSESFKKATFVRINNYINNKGEVSNYTVIANFSYENAKKSDIIKLGKFIPNNIIELNAKNDILNSLLKNEKIETSSKQSIGQKDAYVNITSCIKLHIESNSLKIYAKFFSKEVIKSIEYKKVNSSDLTIAKNDLAKKLKLKHTQYRQFTINKINSIKMNGKFIELM